MPGPAVRGGPRGGPTGEAPRCLLREAGPGGAPRLLTATATPKGTGGKVPIPVGRCQLSPQPPCGASLLLVLRGV